jgi:hypothetical protein
LLFKHKDEPQSKLHVDIGDLEDEKENLTKFLQTRLNTEVYSDKKKVSVDAGKVSMSDLHHAVKKFVYHRSLNTTHWVSIEGSTVKINRFKGRDKKAKKKKEQPHQTLTQSWGL